MKIKYDTFKNISLQILFQFSIIIGIMICLSQTIFAQSPLCSSYPTTFCCEYVSSVSINGQVTQGDNGYTGPGYFDYTKNSITSLVAGQTYPISVTVQTNSTYHEYVKIWFDFNGNLNLQDPGELIFNQDASWFGTNTFSGTFTVPMNAYNGDVYLRVNMVYSVTPALCGPYNYGNTLDYKATISGGVVPHKLTVAKIGSPGYIGDVTSTPAGINTASGFNSANFADGTAVTLTATNATNGTFINWTGDATGSNNSISVAMDANKSVTANFGSAAPPVAITKDISISLDGNGSNTISGTDVNNGSTATCGILSMNVVPSIFTCSQLGKNAATFTVTDNCGKTSTANVVVTVVDNILPTVITKNTTIYLNANGQVNIDASSVNNGSYDNCSIVNLVLNTTAFTCANIGANTVILKAVDPSGNVGSATAIVTIADNLFPIVNTKPFTITLDPNGNGSITVGNINNSSTDNCVISTISLDKTTFNYSNIGNNTVTLTVTDNSGNSASGTAIVTVLANGLNAYGQLVTDRTAQIDQYGAKASGKAKTQYGQIIGSSNTSAGGLSTLNYIAYFGTGVSPAIPATAPILSIGTVSQINIEEGYSNILNTGRNTLVQIHFTGNVVCPGITGINKSIKFYEMSDDGFILSINNNIVINNWIDQGPTLYNGSCTLSLTGGVTYPIDIWYYQNQGPAGLKLFWDIGDGKGIVIVPAINSVL